MSKKRDEFRAEFERRGEAHVRSAIAMGKYSGDQLTTANAWLSKKDSERARRHDRRAQGVHIATWIAAIGALIGTIITAAVYLTA